MKFIQFRLCTYDKINKNILHTSKNMFKIHYTITIFIYINYLKLYSLHKTHERMIDMAGGNEFNLDETIKFLNDCGGNTIKSLEAIKEMKLDSVDECTNNIKKALAIIKSNKDFRKKHLSTRSKDKSDVAHSYLSTRVLAKMVALDLGGKQIDTRTTNTKTNGKSKTVAEWAALEDEEINTTTKKHFGRVSRQADVLVYQYIYNNIQKIIPHTDGTNLSEGFNFLTSLAKLKKRLNVVIAKAQKAQKGYTEPKTTEKENPPGQPEPVPSSGTNDVTKPGGSSATAGRGTVAGAGSSTTKPTNSRDVGNAVSVNATPKPQSENPNGSAGVGPIQPPNNATVTTNMLTASAKKDKWVAYGDQGTHLMTYLVKYDDFKTLPGKQKKEKYNTKYDVTAFINALKPVAEFTWFLGKDGGWHSVKDKQTLERMEIKKVNFGKGETKLDCWTMSTHVGKKGSPELNNLRTKLEEAGVKMAKTLK